MTLAECRTEMIRACTCEEVPTTETFNKAIDSVTRLERIKIWLDVDQDTAMKRIMEIMQEE